MIEECLQSKFVQLNFFIHNLAQLKFSSHSDGELLSFIPTTYSMATDGRIINVEIFDYQKRYHPEKHYVSNTRRSPEGALGALGGVRWEMLLHNLEHFGAK